MLQLCTPDWGQGTGDSQNSLAGCPVAVNGELHIIKQASLITYNKTLGAREVITTASKDSQI